MNSIETIGAGVLTTVLAYIIGRKKTVADIRKTNAESLKLEADGTSAWHDLVLRLQFELTELRDKNERDVSELKAKVEYWQNKYEKEVKELREENNELKERLRKLENDTK